MTKWFCDKCNKEVFPIELSNISISSASNTVIFEGVRGIKQARAEPIIERQSVELCKSCAELFNKYINKFMRG